MGQENSSHGLHLGARGDGPRFTGLCTVGVCGSLGGVGVSWCVGLFLAGVCRLRGVGDGESCIVGRSLAGACAFLGGGGSLLRGPGPCALGECGPLGGDREGSGRGCGAWFACGVSALVFAIDGVWSHVGPEVGRWSLLSTAELSLAPSSTTAK